MKKHVSRILCVLFAIVLTFALTACSSNNDPVGGSGADAGPPPAQTQDTPADTGGGASSDSTVTEQEHTSVGQDTPAEITTDDITLTVWESLNGPDEFIKQAGEAFTALYPNIKINFVNVELGDSSGQIALDGPAGIGPDLFAAPHDKLGELVQGGHIATVAPSVIAHVLEGCAKAVTYSGNTWGYPVSTETYGLFYNKDLIDAPPATWEDVITFSADFNANNSGKYGFVMDVGNAYYTILFTSSNQNQLFGPDGTDVTDTRINSADSAAGMAEFLKLRSVLDIAAADLGTDMVDGLFQSGNAAMHITGPWNFKNFKDAGLNFGVTSLPALPGNTSPAMSFSGTRCMFVSAYSSYQAEAALFAEFLISDEMQALRYDITGTLPSVAITVGGEFGDYATGMLKQMDYAYPMPSIPQMGSYWDAMNTASANIWNGDGSNIQAELDAVATVIMGG